MHRILGQGACHEKVEHGRRTRHALSDGPGRLFNLGGPDHDLVSFGRVKRCSPRHYLVKQDRGGHPHVEGVHPGGEGDRDQHVGPGGEDLGKPGPLTSEEQREYDIGFSIYRGYLQSRGIRIRSARDYQRFVMRSGRDPEARRALLARNRAMDLAMNSSAKVNYLKQILLTHPDDKALVFTRHNKLVYRVSRDMLIPAITQQTPSREREEILERFKSGVYRRIVTSQVLDEGVDVPNASLAVVLSGTGSSRQFIQRLGRVLRKGDGKKARLIEFVSKGTAETRVSRRRRGR